MLVEDIDHTIHNAAFDYLVLSVYSNSCSFFWSLVKFITYSYLHAYVIDFVNTITTIIRIKGILIKTHYKLIKKATFYSCKFFLSKANLTMTKEIWIKPLSFLHPLKGQLSFLSTLLSKKISSQGHYQQFWPLRVATFCNNDHCICYHWCAMVKSMEILNYWLLMGPP